MIGHEATIMFLTEIFNVVHGQFPEWSHVHNFESV